MWLACLWLVQRGPLEDGPWADLLVESRRKSWRFGPGRLRITSASVSLRFFQLYSFSGLAWDRAQTASQWKKDYARIPSVSHRPLGPLLDEEQCAVAFQAFGHSGQCERSAGSAADADCGSGVEDFTKLWFKASESHTESRTTSSPAERRTARGLRLPHKHHSILVPHNTKIMDWKFRKGEELVSQNRIIASEV